MLTTLASRVYFAICYHLVAMVSSCRMKTTSHGRAVIVGAFHDFLRLWWCMVLVRRLWFGMWLCLAVGERVHDSGNPIMTSHYSGNGGRLGQVSMRWRPLEREANEGYDFPQLLWATVSGG